MSATIHERDNIIVGTAIGDRPVPLPAPRAAEVAPRLRGTTFSASHAHAQPEHW